MLNNHRTRPTRNSINNDGRRNGFVGDDPTILLIPQALDNQEWCSRFTSLKGKLKSEFSEMPSDIRVSKTFATLRGLCLGPEAVMSLNSFERRYYDMEYRIKSQIQGHSRLDSFGTAGDWAAECVLSEQASTEVSGIADSDHASGSGESSQLFDGNSGEEQDKKGDGRAGSHEEDLSSPNSSSTILGPYSENGRKLPHRNRIDVNSRSNNVFRHTRVNYKDSPSSHYLSPSLLNSPATARLEGFSPILSPVRENKIVEESWRNENSYPASAAHIPSKDEPVSPFSSLYQRRSLAGFRGSPRVANNRRKLSSPGFDSQDSIFTSRGNSTQDKVLPPLSYSSPSARRVAVELFKRRSDSTPIILGDSSLIDSPKNSKVARPGYPRISPGGATLAQSPPGEKRYSGARACGPRMNSSREDFRGLESRTPTPIGRVVDDKAIQERHKSLGEGARVSFFPTKTSTTTASESSVVNVTKYSQSVDQQQQNVICTPPRKAVAGSVYQTPRGAHQLSTSLHYDDLNPSPKRYNARFSITPSLLSSPEGKSKFGAREDISEDSSSQRSPLPRENSAASTIFSAATNSTGDIPNLAPGIFSDSNRRRYSIPRAPRLIEITKNPYGGSVVVPVDEDRGKQPEIISDTVKSVDMVDEDIEIHPLAASKTEKGIESATRRSKSYGEASKKLSAQNSAKRSLSYGDDYKTKEAARKDTKKYSNAVQEDLEGTRKDPGPKKHGTEKVLVANMAKTSPKSKGDRAIQRLAMPQPLVGGRQKNANAEEQIGVSSLGRSFRRALGNGSGAPATSSGVRQGNAGKTEKSYMRPLVKNELSTPRRNISSGTLPSASNKSSARFGGQPSGRKGGEQTLLSQKNSKSVDSLRRQKITQDVVEEDRTLLAATSMFKSGSKASLTISTTASALEELAKKSIPGITIETDTSPSKFKDSLGGSNGGVLMDITGIGSASNPRTTPITSRNWFGRRSNETLLISRPVPISGPVSESYSPMDSQKENSRPLVGNYQQYPQPQKVTPKAKTKPLGNLTNWLSSSSRRLKGKSSPLTPNGHFSQEEVDDLIKRLSAQIPQSPGLRNGFNVLGGRYYSSSVPSLEKSPSKDEKDRNPIAVCMDLINAASNESQSPKRESLLQMSRVMVDAVSKSRDAECAADEAKMAANRAEMAFLETRKHLAEMTELMKHKKEEI